jgi:hypothetical protein
MAGIGPAGLEVLHMKRLALLSAVSVALLGFVIGGLVGCSQNTGSFIGNRRPGVLLTATPPEGDTTRYDVEFHWTAWDYDGEVDYFIYSIDPPSSAGADTDWIRTDNYSGQFTFTTPSYDISTIDDFLDWKKPQVALGYHVFVLKAVDDRGAQSPFDYLAFNAGTICPRTTISSPPPAGAYNDYQGGGQPVGLRVSFRWDGDDPDGIISQKPVGYVYKVADVTNNSNWKTIADSVIAYPSPWIPVGIGTTKVTVAFDNGRNYGFAVRAIDEASAVEPLLVLNRNLEWVTAAERSSFPEITVKSAAFGVRKWTGWTQDTEEYEVPLGSTYEFTIAGDASWYGGLIGGYAFAWDLDTISNPATSPDGIRAWTPWSTTRTTIEAQFTEPRDYYLYVKCKDDGVGLTLASIHFNVVTLNPDKYLGYIDDWRRYPKTTGEAEDDRVWQEMLRGYDYGDGWTNLVWDEWNAPYREEMPTLQFLSQFKALAWSLNDTRMISPADKSAWYQMNYLSTMNVLAVYLGSESSSGERGKLWAFGRGLVESSVLPYGGTACQYPYAVFEDAGLEECKIRKRSFAFDYMHITGDFVGSDKEGGGARINLLDTTNDYLVRAYADTAKLPIPGYTRPPAAVLYPNLPRTLELDPVRGKSVITEVLEFPKPTQTVQLLFYDRYAQKMTKLIPLYRFQAKSTTSTAYRKYCAFRYLPSGPTDHGEVVYFFVHPFYLRTDDARALAKVVLTDWFGLPDPDAAAPEGALARQ